jgi:pimeloyl-ACP methyl ester carboxylesterase
MSAWVLLRGLTRERAHWGAFPAILAGVLAAPRIVAVDLPGAGTQRGQRCPADVGAIMQACRAQLAEQGVAPPYRLLGVSLGAMVAVEWARAHPGELAACVLVNTSLRPFSPAWRRLRPHAWGPLLRRLLAGGADRAWEETVLRLTSNRGDTTGAVLEDWTEIRRIRPVSRGNALRQLMAAARYRAPDAPPAVPTLVLASTSDRLVDVRCSRELARRWDLPIVEHPGAGHDLTLDDPGWVAARVAQWSAVGAAVQGRPVGGGDAGSPTAPRADGAGRDATR